MCPGDSSEGPHLISFRTQKLSSLEAMILGLPGKVARRQNKEFKNYVRMVHMSWAARRQILYICIVLLFLGLVSAYPIYVIFIKHTPTCNDGIQNGNQQLYIKYQRNGASDCPPINIFFNKPILRQQEI